MKKIFALLCCIATILVSGCDLSHKHYYNDRGVCTCGHDSSIELNYKDGEYSSIGHDVKQGETYYYKFTAHGEEGMDFYIEGENITFDRVEIRADNMLQSTAGPKNYSETIYTYDKFLTNDLIYYLKVTYEKEGNISLVLKSVI